MKTASSYNNTTSALSQHDSPEATSAGLQRASGLVGHHEWWLCDSGAYGESYLLGFLQKTTHTIEEGFWSWFVDLAWTDAGSKELLKNINEMSTVIKKNFSSFFFFPFQNNYIEA